MPTERKTFDLHDAVAVAYPGTGRSFQGKVHVFNVPKAGTALSYGVYVEGDTALLELRKAVDHALGERTTVG